MDRRISFTGPPVLFSWNIQVLPATVEDRAVSLCAEEGVRDREAAGAEHRQNHDTYPDVLNYRGDDTEHDLSGTAYAGAALFSAIGRRRVEIAVWRGE
jgi:hypothetical protein